MSKVTIAGGKILNWPSVARPNRLAAYANIGFMTPAGDIIQRGVPGVAGRSYIDVPLTYNAGDKSLSYPSFQLDVTENSIDEPSATWGLYLIWNTDTLSGGLQYTEPVAGLDSFKVPPSPTLTTLEVLKLYQRGIIRSPGIAALPGLLMYVRSRSLAATNQEQVATVSDESGAANNATQGTSANKPLYQAISYHGYPALKFTGGFNDAGAEEAGQWLNLPSSLTVEANSFTLIWFGRAGHIHQFGYAPVQNYIQLKAADESRFVGIGRMLDIGTNTHTNYGIGAHLALQDTGILESNDFEVLILVSSEDALRFYTSKGLAYSGAPLAPGTLEAVSLMATKNGFAALGGELLEAAITNQPIADYAARQLMEAIKAEYALSAKAPILIFDGDSLTFGLGASHTSKTYPAQIVAALNPARFEYRNFGVVGQTLLQMQGDAATQVYPLFDDGRAQRIALVWAGTNDIQAGASGATAYARLVTYCDGLQANGADEIVVLTPLPREDFGTAQPFHETERQALRTLILTNAAAKGWTVSDVGNDSLIGQSGQPTSAVTLYRPDKVHLTDAGYVVVANYVRAAVLSIL